MGTTERRACREAGRFRAQSVRDLRGRAGFASGRRSSGTPAAGSPRARRRRGNGFGLSSRRCAPDALWRSLPTNLLAPSPRFCCQDAIRGGVAKSHGLTSFRFCEAHHPGYDARFPCMEKEFSGKERNFPWMKTNFSWKEKNFPCLKTNFPWMKTNFPGKKKNFPWMKKRFPWKENNFPGMERNFSWMKRNFSGLETNFPCLEKNFPGKKNDFPYMEKSASGKVPRQPPTPRNCPGTSRHRDSRDRHDAGHASKIPGLGCGGFRGVSRHIFLVRL
jgi:hypothetical protein